MAKPETNDVPAPEQIDYLLRRAQQESIAAIRSVDPRAAGLHEQMADLYGAQARNLLAR